MFSINRRACLLAALCLMIVNPSDLLALNEHVRDGWVLGLSMGAGPGGYKSGEGDKWSESGGVFALRLARKVHSSVSLGVEINGYSLTEEYEDDWTRLIEFDNIALAGTFYPQGGWYVRAGIGKAQSVDETTRPKVIDIILTKVEMAECRDLCESESGWGLLLGGGYELRTTKKLALGLGLSFNKLFSFKSDFYSEPYFGSVLFAGVGLDINWYF